MTSSAFSLGYEMAYTNVLNMLDLAGLPLRSERTGPELTPLIVAGGPAAITRSPWPPSSTCLSWGRGRRSPWSTSRCTGRPRRRAGPRRSSSRRGRPDRGHLRPLLVRARLPRGRHPGRDAPRRAPAPAGAGDASASSRTWTRPTSR
ncbi:MAG: hypothetical protein V8S34_04735 [Lawsonibacter sp.]